MNDILGDCKFFNNQNGDMVSGGLSIKSLQEMIIKCETNGKQYINFKSVRLREPKKYKSGHVRCTHMIVYDDWQDKPRDTSNTTSNASQQRPPAKTQAPVHNDMFSKTDESDEDMPF